MPLSDSFTSFHASHPLHRSRSSWRWRQILCTCCCIALAGPAAEARAEADPDDAGSGGHAHEHRHDEHSDVEEIVVTASPLEHDRDELARPVTRVDRDEILDHLGSTLGETLSHIPGISTTGFAGGASRPVVRGQDAYRTEVLEDGARTQDVSRESPDHAVPINPLTAKHVEVVRGPATLRYGGGASAGVVDVITNRVPDQLPSDGFSGEVFGGIGLLANERDLAATLDGAFHNLAWHADGVLRTANDYTIPNDDRPHVQAGTQVDAFMGSVGASYFLDQGRLGFSYTRAENEYGIPEDGEPVSIDMRTDRFRFEGDLEEPLPGLRAVRVRGVYSDYEHDEIADGEVGQTYRNEEFEGRLEAIHETIFGFTGAIGIHGRTRDFRGEGEAAEFLAPTETTMAAVYLFEETDINDFLSAELGFRVEHVRVEGRDIADLERDRSFVPLSGSAGLVAKLFEGFTVGVSGAISQRAPSQVELLARGAHEATATFEIGDPGLDEETSYTAEFRTTYEGSRGRIEWAGFVTQYDDFIFGARTGNLVDEDGVIVPDEDPEGLAELVYQARDALFYGTELSGQLDLYQAAWGTIGVDGRFDFVRARFRDGADRNLPRIVPIRIGGGFFFASESLDARIGLAHTEPQTRIGAFETSTAGFTHLDASVAYRIEVRDDVSLEATVAARNLTDVRGRNHVSFNKDEILMPGRSIRFGLRTRF